MDILKLNTSPTFQFIPRKVLTVSDLSIKLINELNQKTQTILCTVAILPNENYTITLATFPTGKANDKFSYTLLNGLEIVSLGKLMIVSENENVQDYSKKSVNKFYK